jgi:hypothetical protein
MLFRPDARLDRIKGTETDLMDAKDCSSSMVNKIVPPQNFIPGDSRTLVVGLRPRTDDSYWSTDTRSPSLRFSRVSWPSLTWRTAWVRCHVRRCFANNTLHVAPKSFVPAKSLRQYCDRFHNMLDNDAWTRRRLSSR